MRKSLAVAVATLSVAGVGALVPAAANAACDPSLGCTAATVTLTAAGVLSVAVPDGSTTPISVASANTGAATASGPLGTVTVTDSRGALTASWNAFAVASDFTTGATPNAQQTITAANVSYSAGLGTAAVGQVGAFLPTGPTAIGSSSKVGGWTGVGNDTVQWSPTLTFTLLPAQVAGTYSGTITHSVS